MNKILTITLVSLPIALVACTTETAVKQAPPGGETPAAGEEPQEPEAPSCACPSTCESETMPGKSTCLPGDVTKSPPDKQTIGKFVISSFEYWPWKLPEPIYPDKVQWGFEAGGPEAKKCMLEARKVLVDILKNDVPPELEELRTKHDVYTFYNWNNDMTGAPAKTKIPEPYEGLWLYEEGLIKWMSHTERDGSCRLPTREDLAIFAKSCLKTFPSCGSGK